jgi:hypothetical protein
VEGTSCAFIVIPFFLNLEGTDMASFKYHPQAVIVLTIILALGFCPGAMGVPFAGGTGEAGDPYQIATAEQLVAMGQDPSLYAQCFVLVADLDLDPNQPGGQVFACSVIAPYGPAPRPGNSPLPKLPYGYFEGTFDGNGHIIRNLVIRAENESTAGLFGYVGYGGRIEDLGLEGLDLGRSSVEQLVFAGGGLAAVNQGGTILRCYARGIVAGPERVPEPAGSPPTGRIRALAAASDDRVGGLVGVNAGFVNDCYALVDVSGTGAIGGLIGENSQGLVYFSFAAGRVRGLGWPGGLIGRSESGTSTRAGETTWSDTDTAFRCFWDMEASGITDSAAGAGRTTAELMSRETYVPWTHTGVWMLDDAHDYPRLLWEQTPGTLLGTGQLGYGGGRGTPDDPYQVQTAGQFLTIGCHPEDLSGSFVLTADLDFNDVDHAQALPIGLGRTSFTGQFDGQSHTLSNLTIAQPRALGVGVFGLVGSGAATVCHEGFYYEIRDDGSFGWGSSGGRGYSGGTYSGSYPPATPESTIRNLHLRDVSVVGQLYVGGLVGVGGGMVTDCSVSGQVIGMAQVGGLAGRFLSGGISDCGAAVQASGEFAVGGLVGMANEKLNVFDSRAEGIVTGQVFTGGLIGCSMYNTIRGCAALADVQGRYNAGGCLGSAGNSTVTLSYGSATVTGERFVGGFAGEAANATINDCYCRADVTGGIMVGGFAGHTASTGHITRCYAASSVTAIDLDSPFVVPSVGGFVGFASQSGAQCDGDCPISASACFWDTEVAGLTEAYGNRPADPGTATGLTTAQMQTAAPFTDAGWDLAEVWTLCAGRDYPRLKWEQVECNE